MTPKPLCKRSVLPPLRLNGALTVCSRLPFIANHFFPERLELSVNDYKFSQTTVSFSSWQNTPSVAISSVSYDPLPGMGLQFVEPRRFLACRSARRLMLGVACRLAIKLQRGQSYEINPDN
jgi:hypothetical protein